MILENRRSVSENSPICAGPQSDMTKEFKQKLGFNDSSLHWDLINTEDKRVTARLKNGTVVTVYEKGEFSY